MPETSRSLLLGLALAVLPAPLAQAGTPRLEGPWCLVEGEHVELLSGIGETRSLEVARRLDGFHRALLVLLPGLVSEGAAPRRFVLFEERDLFMHYAALLGAPHESDGLFLGRASNGLGLIWAGELEDPLPLLQHEYVHAILAESAPTLPLWLNEGLAELLTTAWTDGYRAEVGAPVAGYPRLLRKNPPQPLEALLVVEPRSPGYLETARKSRFHADSWIVTHYLLLGRPALAKRIPPYLRALEEGTPPAEAFERGFALSPEALRAELARYARAPKLPLLQIELPPETASRIEPAATRLDTVDTLIQLAERLAAVDDGGRGAVRAALTEARRRLERQARSRKARLREAAQPRIEALVLTEQRLLAARAREAPTR